jgi:hypothetical protein
VLLLCVLVYCVRCGDRRRPPKVRITAHTQINPVPLLSPVQKRQVSHLFSCQQPSPTVLYHPSSSRCHHPTQTVTIELVVWNKDGCLGVKQSVDSRARVDILLHRRSSADRSTSQYTNYEPSPWQRETISTGS